MTGRTYALPPRQPETRFAFGANWRNFSRHLNEDRIRGAQEALESMLAGNRLEGARFLDAGCGSGLISLAATRMGAAVTSFDYDADSVACTEHVKSSFAGDSPRWSVGRGDVLDERYLDSLGTYDVVYSWGVLHHTGNMWRAVENILTRVRPGGLLFIAIYNDQGWRSRFWSWIKRSYNRAPALRPVIVAAFTPFLFCARWLARALTGRLRLERGMSLWHDMIDWLGGYPFEVATAASVQSFVEQRGFRLLRLKACGRKSGCNEFVFERL